MRELRGNPTWRAEVDRLIDHICTKTKPTDWKTCTDQWQLGDTSLSMDRDAKLWWGGTLLPTAHASGKAIVKLREVAGEVADYKAKLKADMAADALNRALDMFAKMA